MDLRPLVEEKLAAHAGEHLFYSQHFGWRDDLSFETYRKQVVAELSRRLGAKLKDLRTPPDPALISIKSWQYGLTDAGDDDAATRGFRDGVYLRLQNFRGDYLDSADWRACLAALDRPDRWLAHGAARERDGWTVAANACFAAARWLDPASEAAIAPLLAARPPDLPARLSQQPAPDFPAQPLGQRHWRAWDMKNYGRLDIPSLLRWSCDRNFLVRARIYRSLGQRPHPAAIQCLHEGTGDPHPFARAQAIRSLGWCADPTFVARLNQLADADSDPEVRRTAAKAAQRIVGYWTSYGEWRQIAGSRERSLAVARQLVDLGLPAAAWDLLVTLDFAGASQEAEPLIDALEPVALLGDDELRSRRYYHWFDEARAVEEDTTPEPSDAEAMAAAGDPGPRGFEARRVLRRRDLGTLAQRRLHRVDWT